MSEEVVRYGLNYTPMPLADWATDKGYVKWEDYQSLLTKYNGMFEYADGQNFQDWTEREVKDAYGESLK